MRNRNQQAGASGRRNGFTTRGLSMRWAFCFLALCKNDQERFFGLTAIAGDLSTQRKSHKIQSKLDANPHLMCTPIPELTGQRNR
jgi:hypothetical protein